MTALRLRSVRANSLAAYLTTCALRYKTPLYRAVVGLTGTNLLPWPKVCFESRVVFINLPDYLLTA